MVLEWLWQGQNLPRLAQGLGLTMGMALCSLIIASVFGVAVGLILAGRKRFPRYLAQFYLESVRIVPLLLWLFVAHFGLSTWTGIHLSGFWVCVAVFSFWGAAEMGDLVRGAIQSIDRHQRETAVALGLSNWQIFTQIEAPQALRRALPGIINLFTRMIKTTSLAALIGVVELIKVGQQIIERSFIRGQQASASIFDAQYASLWVYALIFVLYFLICYPLSLYANHLEQRWSS